MNKSLRELLSGLNADKYKSKVEQIAKEEQEKNGYTKAECIDVDFLIDMLSRGYLDENFIHFIAKTYSNLSENDRSFLIALNEKEPIPFEAGLENFELVEKKMKEFQWGSPAILNNSFVNYMFSKNDESKNFFIIYQIFKNDTESTRLFYEQFLDKLNSSKRNFVLEKIERAIKKYLEGDDVTLSAKLLHFFFVKYGYLNFVSFLKKIDVNSAQVIHLIEQFLDENLVFLQNLLSKEEMFQLMNRLNIKTDVSEGIVSFLGKERLSQYRGFRISKKNLDCILKVFLGNPNQGKEYYLSNYLRVCPDSKNYIPDIVKNILLDFDVITEYDYVIKQVYETLREDSGNLIRFFDKLAPSWVGVIYYARLLGPQVIHPRLVGKRNELFLNPSPVLYDFERAVRDYFSDMSLLFCKCIVDNKLGSYDNAEKILDPWHRAHPILLYLNTQESVWKKMPVENARDLIEYVIKNEEDSFGDYSVVLNLIACDEGFFLEKYPIDKLKTDSNFKRMILRDGGELIKNVWNRAVELTDMPPTDQEGFELYMRAGETYNQYRPVNEADEMYYKRICNDLTRSDIEHFLKNANISYFPESRIHEFFNFVDTDLSDTYVIIDPCMRMLFNRLKFACKRLNLFLMENTFPYPSGMQGFSENVKRNSDQTQFNALLKEYVDIAESIEKYFAEFKTYGKKRFAS
jgi:hypothetical protein